MTAATLVPDIAMDLTRSLNATIAKDKGEALSPDEIDVFILSGQFLRRLFAEHRKAIERDLRRGVDARAFAARYGKSVTGLASLTELVANAVALARAGLRSSTDEFIDTFAGLGEDLNQIQQFLQEAVAKANTPHRPVDWRRVQEAESAYDRGETKPLQR